MTMRLLLNIILLIASGVVTAEDIEVHGRVLTQNNTPIGGVNVLIMGSPNGTTTDMNGYFTLVIPEGSAVLLFSFRKQKPLEHPIEIKRGYQYQVDAVLAGKAQTFNRSYAVTSELPVDAPKIIGMVRDQDNRTVAGAIVTQQHSTFRATSDFNGKFVIPMSSGENMLSVAFRTFKPLAISLPLKQDSTYYLNVILVEDIRKYRDRKSTARLVKSL